MIVIQIKPDNQFVQQHHWQFQMFKIGQNNDTILKLCCFIYSARQSGYVSHLLRQLQWLRVPQRIELRLAVHVHHWLNGSAQRYLASRLSCSSSPESRRRLCSASTASLLVPRALHKTTGDRAFLVTAAKNLEQPIIIDYVTEVSAGFSTNEHWRQLFQFQRSHGIHNIQHSNIVTNF